MTTVRVIDGAGHRQDYPSAQFEIVDGILYIKDREQFKTKFVYNKKIWKTVEYVR